MTSRHVVSQEFAHELMNHLGVALGRTDLLLMEIGEDDPLRSSLEEIRAACQRAIDVTNASRAADTR